ncbi:hypothetical protein C8R43DRAFT_1127327 [Mycena crocata]|nr:hypothetical protein C8R43DRAFT_1127327 [Mycena crocata]
MRRSTRLMAFRELPATDTVMAIPELYDEILCQLTLSELAHYRSVSKLAAMGMERVLAHRVRRYTRPFFPSTTNWDVFFTQLRLRETWIVGSVALAVVSMPVNPATPSNLNAIAPYMWYGYWLNLMQSSFGFSVDVDIDCVGIYSGVGYRYVKFSHSGCPTKVVTITFARASTVYELFIGGGNTNQVHAITAREVVCTDVKGASVGDAVKGWWQQLKEQDALWSPPETGLQHKSPFLAEVTLHSNTATWSKDCGWACPGRPRFTTGLQGVGHWQWGGYDRAGGVCSSGETVNSLTHADFNSDFKSPVFGQWAVDESVYLDSRGDPFHFFLFGEIVSPVLWEDAHRRFRIGCPAYKDPQTAHAFRSQIKTLTAAFREDDDLDCDKSLNMSIRLCTDAVKRISEEGSWIELHVDHVGAGRASLFTTDPSHDVNLIQSTPLCCAEWPLRKGDVVLIQATLHKRESFTFETRNYEILARRIRLLPVLQSVPELVSGLEEVPAPPGIALYGSDDSELKVDCETASGVEMLPGVSHTGNRAGEECSSASMPYSEEDGVTSEGTLTDSVEEAQPREISPGVMPDPGAPSVGKEESPENLLNGAGRTKTPSKARLLLAVVAALRGWTIRICDAVITFLG